MHSLVALATVGLALIVSVSCAQLELLSTNRRHPIPHGPWPSSMASGRLSLNSLANLASLGGASTFRKVTEMPVNNDKGGKRLRLIQTYAGYDVFGSSVEAEMDDDGYFTGQMHGKVARNLYRDIPNLQTCLRDTDDLFNMVIRMENLDPASDIIERKNVIPLIFLDPKTQRGKFTYRVHVLKRVTGHVSLPIYFIDACSQSVLLQFNGIQSNTGCSPCYGHVITKQVAEQNQSLDVTTCDSKVAGVGGNRKTGRRRYDDPPFCLNAEFVNETTCRMIGKYAKVVDNKRSYRRDNEDAIEFVCDEGYTDTVNSAYGVASDVFYYAEAFGCFLREKYRTRAVQGVARYVTHFGSFYENAFYDYDDLYFGDGKHVFYPLTDHSVVSHETAHALTHLNSGLLYYRQSGGINEAFSDITAEAFEHYLTGSHDWVMGWDIMRRRNALRLFDNPSDDGVSIEHLFQYRADLNVHYSSGIYNHAFYRLVEKEGMDIFNAYKCFLHANLLLWTPFTNFRDGACQVMQACYDNGYDHIKVRRAFSHVGILLFTCDFQALTPSLFIGESRQNVYVGNDRAPVIKVELNEMGKRTFTVEAVTDDFHEIRVLVGTDSDFENVIAKGDNSVRINYANSDLYVKLLSEEPDDVRATLKIVETA